jgi:hypothetical protein
VRLPSWRLKHSTNRRMRRQVLECGDRVREVTALALAALEIAKRAGTKLPRPKAATAKTPSPQSKTLARHRSAPVPGRSNIRMTNAPEISNVLLITFCQALNGKNLRYYLAVANAALAGALRRINPSRRPPLRIGGARHFLAPIASSFSVVRKNSVPSEIAGVARQMPASLFVASTLNFSRVGSTNTSPCSPMK